MGAFDAGGSMDLLSEATHDLTARCAAAAAAAGRPVRPARQLNRLFDGAEAARGAGCAAGSDTAFRLGGSGLAGTFDLARPVTSLDQLYSQARSPDPSPPSH